MSQQMGKTFKSNGEINMKKGNYLEQIVHRKRQEVARLIQETANAAEHPLNQLLEDIKPTGTRFSKALKKPHLAVIGEVKRRSPSVGEFGAITDPSGLACTYCQGGASAISVLTDSHFSGTLSDLKKVASSIANKYPSVAILRKDFIIHPLQLAEAVHAGAHAVLLLANVLGKDLKHLIKEANRLGLESLTEIHDDQDLEFALEANAPIIGVNNRNLNTFEIDLNISMKMHPKIPSHIISVSASGSIFPTKLNR